MQNPNARTFSAFHEMPLSSIRPEGWLRGFLERQRQGLTGHCHEVGAPFDSPSWAWPESIEHNLSNWVIYEQTGYWFDGLVRCGALLGAPELTARANEQIDFVLRHPDGDGYLGPQAVKPPSGINRWVHTVFFRAMMARHSATGEAHIPAAIRRHYLSNTSPHCVGREVTNVECILWAYEQTADVRLLDHAIQAYQAYNLHSANAPTSVRSMLSDAPPAGHGVTYNELAKLGAIAYKYTGERKYLDATLNAYRKLDRDHMLISGVPSSTEALHGKDPLESHETCDITDYTWSLGYLLSITGAADWADRYERAMFNAGPGAVKHDFTALQYFSCPNQVLADKQSNHNEFFGGEPWMAYRPVPGTECCTGNVHRFMPDFAGRTWMHDGRGGVAAAMYAPSVYQGPAGPARTPVRIVEDTAYPFSDRITFRVETQDSAEFALWLRVPGWCSAPELYLNDKPLACTAKPGAYFAIQRAWNDGDEATLVLPMRVKAVPWPTGGLAIERGPLVYSLGIEEDWAEDPTDTRTGPGFPAWSCLPRSPWNYALKGTPQEIENAVRVVEGAAMSDQPFTLATAPIALEVPAYKLKGWDIAKYPEIDVYSHNPVTGYFILEKWKRKDGPFRHTPRLPNPAQVAANAEAMPETLRLVPYGATHLRLTLFPWAKEA